MAKTRVVLSLTLTVLLLGVSVSGKHHDEHNHDAVETDQAPVQTELGVGEAEAHGTTGEGAEGDGEGEEGVLLENGNRLISVELTPEGAILHDGEVFVPEEEPLNSSNPAFWTYLFISLGLVCTAGIASGLTVGLMSIDSLNLKILKTSGTAKEKEQAHKLEPIIKNRHLLLVTLLITNAAAMEALPIFLDQLVPAFAAIILSVTFVLIFGEIIPQAVMTKYRLAFGANLVWLVKFLIAIEYVLAYPISLLLDKLLGADHPTCYRRAELKELMELHRDTQFGSLSFDEVTILKGVLDMKDKTAADAMIPYEDVFALSIDDKMDAKTMKKIVESGHSRIPVCSDTGEVKATMLVKSHVMLDPAREVPVRELKMMRALYIDPDKSLFDLLNDFQTGKTHMAIVRKRGPDNKFESGTNVGIITLEDIIEEMMQEEIVDETDVYVDVHEKLRVVKHAIAEEVAGCKVVEQRSSRTSQSSHLLDNV